MSIKPDWISDDGSVQLYCGDCLQVLPTLSGVDAVVTDPPYGLGINYATFNDTQESISDLAAQWLPIARSISPVVMFSCGKLNEWCYPRPDGVLGWASKAGQGATSWGFPCHWPVLAYGKDPYLKQRLGRRPDTLFLGTAKPSVGKDEHPCAKPIEVAEWMITRATTTQGSSVCDPFMGSGTTGVACVKTGRRFIGIELDHGYFEIAKLRIQKAIAEKAELLIAQ